MTNRDKLIAAVTAAKGTLIVTRDRVSILAPPGKKWFCDYHEVSLGRDLWGSGRTGGPGPLAEIYAELTVDALAGVIPCDDCEREGKPCEWCESGDVLPYGESARDVVCGCKTEWPHGDGSGVPPVCA